MNALLKVGRAHADAIAYAQELAFLAASAARSAYLPVQTGEVHAVTPGVSPSSGDAVVTRT